MTGTVELGPARDLVETAIGAPSLFLQGAAGNINPACGIGSGGAEQVEDAHRLGMILGGETLKVAKGDCAWFDAAHPHAYRNPTPSTTAFTLVVLEPV